MADLRAYREFLSRKREVATDNGFIVDADEIHPFLKPHQRAAVQWAVRGGRRALFEAFGLGKTVQQLEIVRLILKRSVQDRAATSNGVESILRSTVAAKQEPIVPANKGDGGHPTAQAPPNRGLIVAPLGVRQEFKRDAGKIDLRIEFIRSVKEASDTGIYITNYETIRDEKLDPRAFTVVSLDEASCLRGLGSTKTFRQFMAYFEHSDIKYRFVATATPDPNEYTELLAYAAFLEIMDVGQAKTRFFKRDSSKADNLTIHPHREKDFWLWVASWALFLQSPADLGFPDDGYCFPPMEVRYHEIPVNDMDAGAERDGQERMFRDSAKGVVEASREKRDTLKDRIFRAKLILDEEPMEHFLLWHDLEAERHQLQREIGGDPGYSVVWGTQDLEQREQSIIDFSEGRTRYLAAKPVIAGSGCNFQYHCARAIFCGIGFKFNDFIQAVHRIYRFLQKRPVVIHIIYAASEKTVLDTLLEKWERHKRQVGRMREMIQEYGLATQATERDLGRTLGVNRRETIIRKAWHCAGPGGQSDGELYAARLVNNDAVEEVSTMESNSVGLILSSIPFSTQYEYTPSFNDFGHSADNSEFFRQMDFLTPELFRVLKPGRIAAIHVKDRVVPGGINQLGFQTVYPFHAECIAHFCKHGFAYMGMKTIVTDVVRENNQTYRLGWTEQCKDGTKMGVGMPEYLLIFRRPPSDTTNSYADEPVVKLKRKYSRSRWQIDAHGFTRSNGNRLLSSEDLQGVPHSTIFKLYRKHSLETIYDFEHHVALGEALEGKEILPVTFMLLQPQSWQQDVWTDITRMRTLNGSQQQRGLQMHLCPMQFDLADRAIAQWTNEGETVLDPFGGLMTVPYRCIPLNRFGIGIELNPAYYLDGVAYCEEAAKEQGAPSLFDLLEMNA